MRVVITGISGLKKEKLFAKIFRLCNSKEKGDVDPDVSLDSTALKGACVDLTFDLEHEMCRSESFETPNYLDITEKGLLNAKNRTLDRIIKKSKEGKNAILGMHTVYYRRSSLFSVLDWSKLKEFQPDFFITLIDNVHSIKDRIYNNPNAGSVKYISLKDILWWREVEFLVTKEIAENMSEKRIPHYLIALDQAPTLIFQLMFESNKKKAYASYPVTTAKRDVKLFNETSEFLKKLKTHFMVFDPMAIGEKLLQDVLVENLKSAHPEHSLQVGEIEYELNDILPVISDINGQIISRDRRLVKQCDIVVAYRPALSPGAQYELECARNTGRVETFAVHPPEDPQSPFISELAETFSTVDRLLERLVEKGYVHKQP
ncbi:hypothetical protein E3J74_04455 [Candidatus Bathyarchaeota archaeon]|nr:MAG: hypothetical protein E3J74_04455 [Candidatus Bathyarchaeota archaeon]